MRLVCPNCGAQYEVPDEVIPTEGRDVQCSNCGITWFQKHPDNDPELAEELDQPQPDQWQDDDDYSDGTDGEDAAPVQPEPEPQTEPEPEAEPENEAAQGDGENDDENEDENEDDFGDDDDDFEDDDQSDDHADDHVDHVDTADQTTEQTPHQPQRRELDPSVASMLREEAEHESRARTADRPGNIETQPDLGLDEPGDESARHEREARNRMARMRGLPEASAATATAAGSASRRDLLPDIEEINSTLRSSSDRREAAIAARPPDVMATAQRRRGFRSGFVLMLLLAVILYALYVFAPVIAEKAPQIGSIMAAYVAQIDLLRGWLDGQIAALMLMLEGAAAKSGS